MRVVLCFAQEWVRGERLAARVFERLRKRLRGRFIRCSSPFDVLRVKAKEIYILDSVKGIERPILIEDTSLLKGRRILSAHDWDISLLLKLMEGLGEKRIRIIGIPYGEGEVERVLEGVLELIGP
jgi:hypothetical protein